MKMSCWLDIISHVNNMGQLWMQLNDPYLRFFIGGDP